MRSGSKQKSGKQRLKTQEKEQGIAQATRPSCPSKPVRNQVDLISIFIKYKAYPGLDPQQEVAWWVTRFRGKEVSI